jgi:RNA polymerase sigma-70 factor (ECF subfamily)
LHFAGDGPGHQEEIITMTGQVREAKVEAGECEHAAVENVEAFAELLAGLRTGNPAVVDGLCLRYSPFIRAAVRRQMHPRLRTRFDSLDLVQDVWASFLAIPNERYTFDTPQALLAFLTRMASHRVVEVFRQRFGTQKNDITRELETTDNDVPNQLSSTDPTPSQWAIAAEEWDRIIGRFPEGHRMILEWLRAGHTNEDIACLAKVSLSTVNRIVRRLKDITGL